MLNIFTIPKKLTRVGELIIIPKVEYEEILKIKKRLLREEADTDEAISIFEKEYKTGRLKKSSTFSEVLGFKKRK